MASRIASASLGLFLSAGVVAQGYVRWPKTTAPVGALTQTGANKWRVHFGGWTTIAGGGPFGPECVGATLATPPAAPNGHGVVTKVSSAEFEDESTGTTAFTNPLFPFAESQAVGNAFQQRNPLPAVTWHGFQAQATRPIPAFLPGAIAFDLDVSQGSDFNAVWSDLTNSLLGFASTDANGNLTGQIVEFGLGMPNGAPLAILPARILAYSFDRGDGALLVNEGDLNGAAPTASIVTTDVTGWATGRFGNALRGSSPSGQTSCQTGWQGGLGGTLTIAFAIQQRFPPGNRVHELFGGLGAFHCFTGGQAGTGVACGGWGNSAPALLLSEDIQSRAANGWVHVALVIDGMASRKVATWFVNGQQRAQQTIPIGVAIPASTTEQLLLGKHQGNQTASGYDLDDFELWSAPLNAAAIAALNQGPSASAASFLTPCGAVLRHQGLPTLGNAAYNLLLEGPANRSVLFTAGLGTRWNGTLLPMDLGFVAPELSGCLWMTDLTVVLPGSLNAAGSLTIPMPVPNQPSLIGVSLYEQAVVLDTGGLLRASNAHLTAVR